MNALIRRLALFVTVIALFLIDASAQTPLPKMPTVLESYDGQEKDTAGPADATNDPQNLLRVYFGQGRVRTHIKLDTRTRMFDEEGDPYDATLLALEVDELQAFLFAATAERDQADPPIPARVHMYDLAPPFGSWASPFEIPGTPIDISELINDIRVIPEDEKLLVISETVIRIFDYSSGTLPTTPISTIVLPTNPPITVTCHASQRTFDEFDDALVYQIGNDRYAILRTVMDHGGIKPRARGLLAAQLTPYTSPFLYGQPSQVYDPVPCIATCLPGSQERPEHYNVHDLDIVLEGTQHLAYLAGGPALQLKILDVSDPGTGFQPTTADYYDLDPSEPDFCAKERLVAIEADPDAPTSSDYLYVTSEYKAHAVERTTGNDVSTASLFGRKGPPRDLLFVLEGSPGAILRKIWTAVTGVVDHVWKVQDVTDGTMGPDVSETHFNPSDADGAVFIPQFSSVYVPTLGGLVRYAVDLTAGTSQADYDSYEPAVHLGKQYFTEFLEIGYFGATTFGADDYRLFIQTAEGGFLGFRVDPATYYPLPGGFESPPPGGWPGWNGTDNTAGNDIEFGINSMGAPYVLLDYTNATTGEVAVQRFTFDTTDPSLSTGSWDNAFVQPTQAFLSSLAHDIATSADGKWAFVACVNGFFVIDLENWTITDEVCTNTAVCPSHLLCATSREYDCAEGIVRYDRVGTDDDRLFVSLSDTKGSDKGGAIVMYPFDAFLGVVGSPIQCLYDDDCDSPPCGQDDFPGVDFFNGGRTRMAVVDVGGVDEVRIYSGTGSQGGSVVEVEYDVAADVLVPLAYWNNGTYLNGIEDCRVYALGQPPNVELRILVNKTFETFGFVEGSM